ncbi:MAG: hypothetical protein NZ570_06635 [Candidatus Caldarchaeum sp.]|nr:hypothetical protein [Candidatus Caldarchaeum sp.]
MTEVLNISENLHINTYSSYGSDILEPVLHNTIERRHAASDLSLKSLQLHVEGKQRYIEPSRR